MVKEKNIFLFYGENIGLKKYLKELILIEKKKISNKINILYYVEDEILKQTELVYNSISSESLFLDKQIFIIEKSSDKFLKILEKILEYDDGSFSFILLSDILDKKSKLRNISEKNKQIICVPCYKDNLRTLEIIAKKELNKEDIKCSNETISFLINKSAGDRNYLLNELNKIKLFSKNNKTISNDQIKKLLYSPEDEDAEQLVNDCLNGNTQIIKKYIAQSHNNNINYILILRVLSRKIEKLISLSELKNQLSIDKIISTAKPPIFWKDIPLIKTQLKNWNINELKKIILEINNVEIECKESYDNATMIFLNFLSSIRNKVSNYP